MFPERNGSDWVMDYNIVFPEREWELVHISTEVTVSPSSQKMFPNFFPKVLTPNCYLLTQYGYCYLLSHCYLMLQLTLTLS